MQKLDVAGFRRMRTISQLTFETFIQLILQVNMLIFFKMKKNGEDAKKLGVSLDAIFLSISLAFLHGVLESIFLAMEPSQTNTKLSTLLLFMHIKHFHP